MDLVIRERRLHRLFEQEGTAANQDDVLQAMWRFDVLLHCRHGLLRHRLSHGHESGDVVGLLENHWLLARSQGQVDGVEVAIGAADVLGDLGGDQAQQVLGVEDADDMVDRLAIERRSTVPLLEDDLDRLVERRLLVDRNDVDAGHHHLVQLRVAQRHHGGDHLLLFGLDDALLAPLLDDEADLRC